MDVSGHVKTSIDHVTSLKAKLCLEDHEESPVHTISLGQVPFFFFPAIPIDDRKYVVILESSLPRQRFDYPGGGMSRVNTTLRFRIRILCTLFAFFRTTMFPLKSLTYHTEILA